ncbi:MAG TPA: TonB family protein [Mucilaginibacter sp.]|nr:TonB family protein [Mucilaginibacter sp.]
MAWWQYLILANLYLVLFYGFYVILLRSETFFQLNRIYLVASAILSFLIPLIHSNWVQNLFITQKVQYNLFSYSAPLMVYHFKPIEDRHITIGQLMLFIYAAGAIIFAARFIWQLISLKKIIDQPELSGAFSFFKSVRLGENADNHVIAAHEQVHAREFHSADILLIELLSIINWFNPVVYFYRRGIKHIHEFIADRQALNNGTDKVEYALLLLSQTFKTPAHQLVNPFFNHSLLKRRIIMLQKNRSQRAALLKYGLSAPLFVLMLILSSATISKSRTVKLFNSKASEVLLAPATSTTLTNDIARIGNVTLKEVESADLSTGQSAIGDTVQKDGRIFTAVESAPMFPGGQNEFYQFLAKTIKYPEAMKKNNIQGKVFLTFIVEKDGSLSDIKSVRDVGYGSAEESVRVLGLSPKWKPGYQNGRAVRVQYTIPISFSMEPKKSSSMQLPGKDTTGNKSDFRIGENGIYNVSNDTTKVYSLNGFTTAPPLYILDGKEIIALKNINPNDIESISILRPKATDKSLLELYGARATNGVVVIKTKNAIKK